MKKLHWMTLAFIAGILKLSSHVFFFIEETPWFDGAIILCILAFLITKNDNE